jgi:hypothetical protein
MLQLVSCLLMLLPLVALPVFVFFVAALPVAIVVALLSLLAAVPVAVAAFAHFDLLRAKWRYGLSDDEVAEFSRLVPRLARTPRFAGLRSREMKRSVKESAAEIIRQRRNRPADLPDGSGGELRL